MTSRKRVSVRQIELLIEFLEGHKDLARGRLKSKEASALSSRLWAECASVLNAEADGDQRTARQWNKWYTDYKCRLFSRIRQRRLNFSGTGGGPGVPIMLSPLEERLAALLGAFSEVSGRSGTPEAESTESEQLNETSPTRQRTRRRSRLNRDSPPNSELEASRNMLANIERSRIEVERMMAVACQTMAEATNKMAEAALKAAEAQGRIAEALENISKAIKDKHA